MMTFPHTVVLKKPVRHGSQEVTELVFSREMVAEDIFDVDLARMTPRDFAQVIARLTNQPRPIIGQLSIPDFNKAMDTVNGFLLDGQETGAGV